jgi:hypothetical protein
MALTVKSAWVSTATTATLDVQPAAAEEWLVHTLVSEAAKSMEVYLTSNGSTFTLVETLTGGPIESRQYLLTNTLWMRLKNIDAGTRFVGYMGRLLT